MPSNEVRNKKAMGPAPRGRTIAFVERQKMLFAQGFGEIAIMRILQTEFSDYEAREITVDTLGLIYGRFKDEFDEARRKFMEDCALLAEEQLQHCFAITRASETKMVETLNAKLNTILDQIAELDLSDKENMKEYKNLLILANETHHKLADVAGTDAVRDFNLFKAKLEFKKEIDEAPTGDARIAKEGRTKFIRD